MIFGVDERNSAAILRNVGGKIMCETSIKEERITAKEYIDFLKRTDLGVDREYEGQGIGSQLMRTAHDLAGGKKDIAVYLIANENAIPFYEKLGMQKSNEVMQYDHIEWTDFAVC